MAVATLIAIPAPRSFVVVDTRFTSALLVKLPLYKARQRHLFHRRCTSWLHLPWVVWVLCRSVNLRVMATTLSVECQRHQNPRHLRAGHCESHSQPLKTSKFVEVGGLEAATTSESSYPWRKITSSQKRMGGLCCTHAEIHGLTMCNPYCKSQGHHVKGFEQMAEKKRRDITNQRNQNK